MLTLNLNVHHADMSKRTRVADMWLAGEPFVLQAAEHCTQLSGNVWT